jgi:hypothetical protein
MARDRPAREPLAAIGVSAAFAVAYLIWAPSTPDLAAATFRADLFASHGFLIWNNDWYSGHYLLSYSVLYPPLGALLGPRAVGAVAVVAAAALFAVLARRRFGAAALVPSLWFAGGVGSWLLTGRVVFLLGVPLGLAALLPRRSGRLWLAAALAVLTSLATPVAGLFVGLAGIALAIAGERARGAALAAGAAVPIIVLNLAFPTGGSETFGFTTFVAVPILAVAVVWLVPAEHLALRVGAVLYAVLAVVVFVTPTALGSNVTRLGALFAGPVMALVLWPRGRIVVIAVSIPLLYWQLIGPVSDAHTAAGDPATERAFFMPLDRALDRLAPPRASIRVEIAPTRNRWEAAYVAPQHSLGRGWLRQEESGDIDEFTGGSLSPALYRQWLEDHGVTYVAIPDAPLDYLGEDEADLVRRGLGYLDPVWSNDDWRLYRVRGATGIVQAGAGRAGVLGARVTSIGPQSFRVSADRPGDYLVRIHYTPYWTVKAGDACVERAGDWTRLVLREPGTVEVAASFSLAGLLRRDSECSA